MCLFFAFHNAFHHFSVCVELTRSAVPEMFWLPPCARAGVKLAVLCSLFANGFQLGKNTSGIGQSECAVPQDHSNSRREVLDKVTCAIALGAVSTLSFVIDPCPSFAEEEGGPKEQKSNPIIQPAITTAPDRESPSSVECDEECKEQRRRRIEERRAMMRQSRSTSSRQEVFELSKQRARLVYGTEYKGSNCIDGVPCL